MSNNQMVFRGFEEFKAQLRNLPSELAGEASGIVIGAAEVAAAAIEQKYRANAHTGDLADGVLVEVVEAGPFGVAARVRSVGNLAWLYEMGSEARHYVTVRGNTHLTGRMPAGNYFIPECIRRRRAMNEALKAMMERHGLTVTGRAA